MYRNEAEGLARPGSTRFVATGIVKLRVKPARTGHVLAKLPVNTPVTVLEARAVPRGWLAVRLSSEPPLFGYVAAAFVSRRPRDAAAVVERRAALRAAGGHVVVKASLERLGDTKAPGWAGLMEKLRSMYGPLADAAAERRIRALMRSERTTIAGTATVEGWHRDSSGHGTWPRSAYNRPGGKRQENAQRWRESNRHASGSERESRTAPHGRANGLGPKS